MTILVKNKHTLLIDEFKFKCCIGKNGSTKSKREGDKKTSEIPRNIVVAEGVVTVMYEDVHTKISELKSKEDRTIDGQVEDIYLKEHSQTFHYFIWTSLAILTILLVIQRMRK